jgi:O-antigen biosynthesis protein
VNALTTPPPLPVDASTESLAFTGERFHPDRAGEMWFEHWHRYLAVTPLVAGKRVLDIASGEGYGSAQLASVAAMVTGVDVSTDAINHAKAQYAAVSNLRFVQGSCDAIPLAAASVDVVVSFETLEHIAEHDAFLREIKRVLTPDGLLIISTPNKAEYTDARGYQNEFHVKELYLAEFETLLAANFSHTKLFGQRNGFHSLIQPLGDTNNQTGMLNIGSMPARAGNNPAPLYVIAFASNNQALIDSDSPATSLPISAFTAKEDNQVDIFMQIWRHSQHLEGRVAVLTAQNQTHEETITKLANELNQLRTTPSNTPTPAPTNTSNESTIERFIKRLSK